MIVKFEEVPGPNIAALFTFIHGGENRAQLSSQVTQPMIAHIKAINSNIQGNNTSYGLTLDIQEGLTPGVDPWVRRVDRNYLQKILEIVWEEHSNKW
jgi:hypothetical protein